MKWTKIAAVDINPDSGGNCAMCHKPVTDVVFCADNFDELQCLLLEKDSGLGVKLASSGSAQAFCICEDCKIRIDEVLKSDSVHIMYCE